LTSRRNAPTVHGSIRGIVEHAEAAELDPAALVHHRLGLIADLVAAALGGPDCTNSSTSGV
jgi:hypothetical protein